MRAAGIRLINGVVEPLRLPGPRELRADEILIEVRAAGVANWDDFVHTGAWDTGTRPPMALGVEAAGLVASVGSSVTGFAEGDRGGGALGAASRAGQLGRMVYRPGAGLRQAAVRRRLRRGRRPAGARADREPGG